MAEPDLRAGQVEVLLICAEAGRLGEYREVLAQAGMEAIRPPSRRAALGHLRQVDLVLVEVGRTDAEGWEICRTIRSRFPHLPLVVVSGEGTEELAGQSLGMGAADHICLPVHPEVLSARILARIGSSRSYQASVRVKERLHRLIRIAPSPIFVLEGDRIRLGNEQFCDVVGLSAEEIGREPFFVELLDQTDGERLKLALERWNEGKARLLRLPVHVQRGGRQARAMELTLARMGPEESGVLVGALAEPASRLIPAAAEGLHDGFFRALIQGAHDLVMVVDRYGTIRYSSPSVDRVMGYCPEELEGQQILTFVHRDDADGTRHLLRQMLDRPGPAVTSRCRLRTANGEWRVMEFTAHDRLDDPEVNGFVVHARDVSDQQRAEDSLRESEARFRLLVEGSRDIFFYVRRTTGELVYVSPTVTGILAYDAADLVGQAPEWLNTPRNAAEPDGTLGSASRLVVAKDRRGEAVTLEVVEGGGGSGGASGLIQGFARDVSERERLQAALRDAAFQDALTGLPNRALFTDRVHHAIARLKRHPDQAFALLFLDLDRFKVINDSLGHTVGDHLLRGVAERLKLYLRPEDTLARFGGDEFAILLEDVAGPADAPRVARRIAEVLALPFELGGYEVYTSASIGIVMASPSSSTPESLLQSADMAMYRAKAGGGNAFELYDQPMHAEAIRRLQLEGHLRRAVEREELCLHYQPVVRLSDRAVVGVEALLRWNHPVYGLIGPADFVGLAEEAGFITEIGQWALQAAVTQLAEWRTTLVRPDLFMSVNLSSRQLRDSGVLRQVLSALSAHDLPPSSLKLEITETALVHNRDRSVRVLREMIQRGIEVFLDDFGTGYTSLSHLLALPLNGLKLDQSFVARMHDDHRYAVLVESTMTIAKGLGLCVIAEGVEKPDQADALSGLGCDLAQGFHFAHPMSAAEAEQMLRAGQREAGPAPSLAPSA